MRSCRYVVMIGVLGFLWSGCATAPVLLALRENRVKLGQLSGEVMTQTGPPDLWIAKDSVETLFYRNGDQAVYISLLDDKVVAYEDRAEWPTPAERGTREASKPVSRGRIRVGMTEAQVRELMGKPGGITAAGGVETFHWVSGDDSDSTIEIKAGRVVGYVDVETTKFTQNIPRHDRKNATTSGQVRVGMTRQEVEARLGRPDSVAAKDGLVNHRYDANAFFGNDLLYVVEYRDDRVVGFSQENLTMAKKERKEKEERERASQKVEEPSSGSRVASLLFGFLLNAAVREAIGKRNAPSAGPGPRPTGGPPPIHFTTCSCPEITCQLAGKTSGLTVQVRSCRAQCGNTRPACSCVGRCTSEQGFIRDHVCKCE